ncbi:MFS transporter [Methylobacterium sp. NEAU 140]|uniref:MFS transporter n=1 Tax=Methylobacterium sp. NEAU 140 TaxID=3064945 RepID=UPI002734BCF9|nr:MFS transporter [Methylobacterium sp. NEAU 140]MDP4022970.1 MFS transporter [Methylobacterium sp. NEAU 140]
MPKARWTMILLCCLANTINYIDRANLAVAAPSMQHDLGIDAATMGVILGGFFWTYAVMQLPAGWFADRVGARIALAVAVVWWSVFTALTSVARSVETLLGCRLLLGIGEAGAYPSMAKVSANWFPRTERALAASIFDSGSRIGSALSLPIVAWLIGTFNWETSFVVTGLLGVAWVVVWFTLYREPENHPAVTPEQLAALRAERQGKGADGAKVPWASLFRYRTIWGMMIGFFCLNFTIYFFITWFPSYLVEARGFSLSQLGTLGLLPALFAIPAGWLGGIVSDALYRRGWSLTRARKTCLVGGMLTSSIITGAAFAPNVYGALACFAIAYGSLAFAAANIWTLPADVAPTPAHVASIGGIQNFASNLAGIVTTSFTGVMLTITSGSFVVPLIVAGAFCVVGAGAYLFIVGEIAPLPALERGAVPERSPTA